MAKVFISFLGTSKYSRVTYEYNDGNKPSISTQTRFVQIALINSICQDWNEDDRIIIFRTEVSDKMNWNDFEFSPGALSIGLKRELKESKYTTDLKCQVNPGEAEEPNKYIVPTGFTESDLWEIFEKVYNFVNDGDEIYFDVTHAFRTIPLFTTVLFNYCRFMKNSTVKSIHYGAYESTFTINDLAKKTDAEKSEMVVPLVDLTNASRLQAVNNAASNFKQFGSFGSLIEILDTDKDKLEGEYDIQDALLSIKSALENLNFHIMTNNFDEIKEGEYIRTINEVSEIVLKNMRIPAPQKTLLKTIREELNSYGFKGHNCNENIESAIAWASGKGQLQQAITLANEYLKDRYLIIYEKKGFATNENYTTNSSCISFILSAKKKTDHSNYSIVFDGNKQDQWKNKVAINGFNPKEVLEFINIDGVADIQEPFNNLKELRNQLNHAYAGDIKSMNHLYEIFMTDWKKCLNQLQKTLTAEYMIWD